MSCQWTQEHIDAYELGQLGEAGRQRLDEHLATCGACRALLAEVRATDSAVRAALEWAEPDGSFAERVLEGARPRRWRRWASAAAVAALLGIALLHSRHRPTRPDDGPSITRPRPAHAAGGRLLVGALRDSFGLPVTRVERGRPYEAAAPAAIALGRESLFLVTRGTRFACGPYPEDSATAMTVRSGTLLGQIRPRPTALVVELAGTIVRTTGCQFYSTGIADPELARNGVLPPAAVHAPTGEVRLHVFAGELEVDLGTQHLRLTQGESCIISCGVTPGHTRPLERRVAQLRLAIGQEALALRRRYERLCAAYARRLLELRAATGPKATPYRTARIALVESLLKAHAKGLSRLEGSHSELFELDAAEAELERLDLLREEADSALEQLVRLVSSAG